MRAPRGLTMKFDHVERERVYFKVRATKFYLFKTIVKIAGQNRGNPLLACLIFGYALYYLMNRGL